MRYLVVPPSRNPRNTTCATNSYWGGHQTQVASLSAVTIRSTTTCNEYEWSESTRAHVFDIDTSSVKTLEKYSRSGVLWLSLKLKSIIKC